VDLLRSCFVTVGFLGAVTVDPVKKLDTAEGALSRPDVYTRSYHIASPLADGLICRFLISQKFPGGHSLIQIKGPSRRCLHCAVSRQSVDNNSRGSSWSGLASKEHVQLLVNGTCELTWIKTNTVTSLSRSQVYCSAALTKGDERDVSTHIEKTAHETWIVHFTCDDDYLNHPTDKQLEEDIT